MRSLNSEAEIATITGHSLRDVRSILDAHYLHRDPALAQEANRKLEAGTKTPKRAPTALRVVIRSRGKCNLIKWLGDLDSNQDWRSQSPLSYR